MQLKEMTKGQTGNKSKDNENTKKNDDMKGMDHSDMDMGSDKRFRQYGRSGPWKYEDGRS